MNLTHLAHSNNNIILTQVNDNNSDAIPDNFTQEIFTRGFGVPLNNSAGNEDGEWHIRWMNAMRLKRRQYF